MVWIVTSFDLWSWLWRSFYLWRHFICDEISFVTTFHLWRNFICDVVSFVTSFDIRRSFICDVATTHSEDLNQFFVFVFSSLTKSHFSEFFGGSLLNFQIGFSQKYFHGKWKPFNVIRVNVISHLLRSHLAGPF